MSSRGREGFGQAKLLDERPYFFKVVYSPVNQGLRIPTGFMEDNGISLKNKRVVLKVRTGDSWPIQLRRTDDGFWLGNGWPEFAAFYAIQMGQFLVFRYEGNFQFSVIIFSPSGMEIKQYRQVRKLESSEDHYRVSVEIEIEEPGSSRPTWKRRKTGLEPENVANRRQPRRPESIREEQHSGTRKPCAIPESHKENFLSYKRAKAFAADKCVFIVFMQPSYVSNKFRMNFPLSFSQGFIPSNKNFDVELHVSGLMEVWPLKCTYDGRQVKTLTTEWKQFVLDNKLVFGDVCVFEWANPSLILNVKIFRNS